MGRFALYVGGISEDVTEPLLRAAFIPFGELLDVQVPLDMRTQKNKGFAFVEYELEEDAAAAVENMDGAELFGRWIRVNAAKGGGAARGKAVWAEASDWYKNLAAQADGEDETAAPAATGDGGVGK
jgi:peptidyl-prolyl isomerase E (cyclophilin E)